MFNTDLMNKLMRVEWVSEWMSAMEWLHHPWAKNKSNITLTQLLSLRRPVTKKP